MNCLSADSRHQILSPWAFYNCPMYPYLLDAPLSWVRKNPEVPFVSAIVGGMFPGRAVVVAGHVLQSNSQKRFAIDLCCGLLISGDHMDNKALHFNPRFESGGLKDNSRPHVIPSSLSCQIAVNGKHLCDYEHRVPVDQIKTISIGGNIRADYVEFQPPIAKDGNIQNGGSIPRPLNEVTRIDKPTIPFSLAIPIGGFVSPQLMQFTLTPFISGERFVIDLYSIAESVFHFRIDMPKDKQKDYDIRIEHALQPAVVRNSTQNGVWQKEERDIGEFPFHKGITHDITFIAYAKSVAVDVDGMPFVKFIYRGDDPSRIDRVTVKGDCVLQRFIHRG
ncbi:hypothetical protein WR25_12399 [Diploscapter pachys]|uniref:Galectin n=1 Tax=Diploscapter pachys TaxID=2018661 RepID=A0A2A2JNN7_9BILA|nr:hypothetical protein WR25_12399 [Diploscapter pachys]